MYIQTTECLLSESVKFMCIPLETGREMSLWRAFLACIAASANKFYFYRHVTYCVYPAMSEGPKQLIHVLKKG